ncbi:MAG: MFS transporter [Candidatus Hydrogenedentales bacterium]
MNFTTKFKLSLMMFLEFFIWGAWCVTLASYLLFNLKFTGGQVGNIFLTMAIASIISPIFVGMVADKFFPAQHLMGVLHLVGGILMFFLAHQVQTSQLFFIVLLGYTLCYMPTLSLANTVCFNQMTNTEKEFPLIRSIGVLGWIVVGLFLGYMKIETTNIPLYIASGSSFLMGFYCFFLPNTPPKGAGEKMRLGDFFGVEAFGLLKDKYFFIFALASLLISMTTSFYINLGNPFFVSGELPYPAAMMTGGQISEAVITALLAFFFVKVGVKWMLSIGMLSWALRYALMMSDPGPGYSLWILSIVIHGFCYGFFFTAGQVYVGNVASKSIQASAQGLIALITFGLGQGAGSIISGRILEHYTVDGAIQWSQVWFLPMIVALVVGVLFALLFRVKPTEAKAVDIAEA